MELLQLLSHEDLQNIQEEFGTDGLEIDEFVECFSRVISAKAAQNEFQNRQTASVKALGLAQGKTRRIQVLKDNLRLRWSDDALRNLFREVDYDGDLSVTWEEFTSFCIATAMTHEANSNRDPGFKDYLHTGDILDQQSHQLRKVIPITVTGATLGGAGGKAATSAGTRKGEEDNNIGGGFLGGVGSQDRIIASGFTRTTIHDAISLRCVGEFSDIRGHLNDACFIPQMSMYICATDQNYLQMFDVTPEGFALRKQVNTTCAVTKLLVPVSNHAHTLKVIAGDRDGYLKRLTMDPIRQTVKLGGGSSSGGGNSGSNTTATSSGAGVSNDSSSRLGGAPPRGGISYKGTHGAMIGSNTSNGDGSVYTLTMGALEEHSVKLHSDAISAIDWIPFAAKNSLITAGMDKKLYMVDFETFKIDATLKSVHQKYIRDISVSHYHRAVATCGREHYAAVLPLDNPSAPASILQDMKHPHTNSLVSVRFIPNSHQLLTADSSGLLKVWDARQNQCVYSFHTPKIDNLPIEYSGKQVDAVVYSEARRRIFTTGKASAIYQYDTKRAELTAHAEPLVALTYNPITQTIVSATATDVRIWNSQTGSPVGHFVGIVDAGAEITCLSIDHVQGRRFFLGTSTGYMACFLAITGRELWRHNIIQAIITSTVAKSVKTMTTTASSPQGATEPSNTQQTDVPGLNTQVASSSSPSSNRNPHQAGGVGHTNNSTTSVNNSTGEELNNAPPPAAEEYAQVSVCFISCYDKRAYLIGLSNGTVWRWLDDSVYPQQKVLATTDGTMGLNVFSFRLKLQLFFSITDHGLYAYDCMGRQGIRLNGEGYGPQTALSSLTIIAEKTMAEPAPRGGGGSRGRAADGEGELGSTGNALANMFLGSMKKSTLNSSILKAASSGAGLGSSKSMPGFGPHGGSGGEDANVTAKSTVGEDETDPFGRPASPDRNKASSPLGLRSPSSRTLGGDEGGVPDSPSQRVLERKSTKSLLKRVAKSSMGKLVGKEEEKPPILCLFATADIYGAVFLWVVDPRKVNGEGSQCISTFHCPKHSLCQALTATNERYLIASTDRDAFTVWDCKPITARLHKGQDKAWKKEQGIKSFRLLGGKTSPRSTGNDNPLLQPSKSEDTFKLPSLLGRQDTLQYNRNNGGPSSGGPERSTLASELKLTSSTTASLLSPPAAAKSLSFNTATPNKNDTPPSASLLLSPGYVPHADPGKSPLKKGNNSSLLHPEATGPNSMTSWIDLGAGSTTVTGGPAADDLPPDRYDFLDEIHEVKLFRVSFSTAGNQQHCSFLAPLDGAAAFVAGTLEADPTLRIYTTDGHNVGMLCQGRTVDSTTNNGTTSNVLDGADESTHLASPLLATGRDSSSPLGRMNARGSVQFNNTGFAGAGWNDEGEGDRGDEVQTNPYFKPSHTLIKEETIEAYNFDLVVFSRTEKATRRRGSRRGSRLQNPLSPDKLRRASILSTTSSVGSVTSGQQPDVEIDREFPDEDGVDLNGLYGQPISLQEKARKRRKRRRHQLKHIPQEFMINPELEKDIPPIVQELWRQEELHKKRKEHPMVAKQMMDSAAMRRRRSSTGGDSSDGRRESTVVDFNLTVNGESASSPSSTGAQGGNSSFSVETSKHRRWAKLQLGSAAVEAMIAAAALAKLKRTSETEKKIDLNALAASRRKKRKTVTGDGGGGDAMNHSMNQSMSVMDSSMMNSSFSCMEPLQHQAGPPAPGRGGNIFQPQLVADRKAMPGPRKSLQLPTTGSEEGHLAAGYGGPAEAGKRQRKFYKFEVDDSAQLTARAISASNRSGGGDSASDYGSDSPRSSRSASPLSPGKSGKKKFGISGIANAKSLSLKKRKLLLPTHDSINVNNSSLLSGSSRLGRSALTSAGESDMAGGSGLAGEDGIATPHQDNINPPSDGSGDGSSGDEGYGNDNHTKLPSLRFQQKHVSSIGKAARELLGPKAPPKAQNTHQVGEVSKRGAVLAKKEHEKEVRQNQLAKRRAEKEARARPPIPKFRQDAERRKKQLEQDGNRRTDRGDDEYGSPLKPYVGLMQETDQDADGDDGDDISRFDVYCSANVKGRGGGGGTARNPSSVTPAASPLVGLPLPPQIATQIKGRDFTKGHASSSRASGDGVGSTSVSRQSGGAGLGTIRSPLDPRFQDSVVSVQAISRPQPMRDRSTSVQIAVPRDVSAAAVVAPSSARNQQTNSKPKVPRVLLTARK